MVRRWTPDAVETLQVCLEVTDWDVFCDVHREYINSLTDCINGYVNFCTYNIISTKTVHCFPNNKPWETKDIKAKLNRKKAAFRSGDMEEMKRGQSDFQCF